MPAQLLRVFLEVPWGLHEATAILLTATALKLAGPPPRDTPSTLPVLFVGPDGTLMAAVAQQQGDASTFLIDHWLPPEKDSRARRH